MVLKKTFWFLILSFLVLMPSTARSKKPAGGIEVGGGITGCIGSYCEKGTPSWAASITPWVRISDSITAGFNFLYGNFSSDEFDSLSYYTLGIEIKYHFNISSKLSFFLMGQLNYNTLMLYGNNDRNEDRDFSDLRATGPGLSAGTGLIFRITSALYLGLDVRFTFPIWSEACFTADEGRLCREPQDEEVKLDLYPFYAGITIGYTFPE
ncbi:porin family protein [Myxococcota bacterium]|nr:porin family protein [Myxococcota bacterium]MBU1379846.1 porin family protein [Myxococcota bacterium]MBU1496495.1 porin family protein [Myxococcota bacterium]